MNSRNLQLYITAESPCGYYEDRSSRNVVPDPEISLNMSIYNQLIAHGFRRSGDHTYRPHCDNCQACLACRVPVSDFTASRSQRRCLNANKDLKQTVVGAGFSEEYFELYQRYLAARHGDGSMADPCEDDFKHFLYCDWCDTQFLEFRLKGKLVALAVTDVVADGLSAVYSFFDPAMVKNGLGTYCVLKQIDYAKQSGLDYIYLGYWIKDHPKMHYKAGYRPLQIYRDESWQTVDNSQ